MGEKGVGSGRRGGGAGGGGGGRVEPVVCCLGKVMPNWVKLPLLLV